MPTSLCTISRLAWRCCPAVLGSVCSHEACKPEVGSSLFSRQQVHGRPLHPYTQDLDASTVKPALQVHIVSQSDSKVCLDGGVHDQRQPIPMWLTPDTRGTARARGKASSEDRTSQGTWGLLLILAPTSGAAHGQESSPAMESYGAALLPACKRCCLRLR